MAASKLKFQLGSLLNTGKEVIILKEVDEIKFTFEGTVLLLKLIVMLMLCSLPSHRETMLQALRFVIQGAGSKVDPTIRKNITTTLLGMLGHDEV